MNGLVAVDHTCHSCHTTNTLITFKIQLAKNYFDFKFMLMNRKSFVVVGMERDQRNLILSECVNGCSMFQIISEYIYLIQKISEYMSKYVKLICKNNIRIYWYIWEKSECMSKEECVDGWVFSGILARDSEAKIQHTLQCAHFHTTSFIWSASFYWLSILQDTKYDCN